MLRSGPCSVALASGNPGRVPDRAERLDPDDVLSTIERERANLLLIVGDAFARPLLDQLRRKAYDLSCLSLVGSGGAPLSIAHKEELPRAASRRHVLDAIGSSETGGQGTNYTTRGSEPRAGASPRADHPNPVCEPGPRAAAGKRTRSAGSSREGAYRSATWEMRRRPRRPFP